jgi:hypothetical protein
MLGWFLIRFMGIKQHLLHVYQSGPKERSRCFPLNKVNLCYSNLVGRFLIAMHISLKKSKLKSVPWLSTTTKILKLK